MFKSYKSILNSFTLTLQYNIRDMNTCNSNILNHLQCQIYLVNREIVSISKRWISLTLLLCSFWSVILLHCWVYKKCSYMELNVVSSKLYWFGTIFIFWRWTKLEHSFIYYNVPSDCRKLLLVVNYSFCEAKYSQFP